MSNVPHVPKGLTPLIPQLVVKDGMRFIGFLEAAFGAKTGGVMHGPDGKSVMHAFVLIEGQPLFVAGPFGPAPETRGNQFLYVKDVDAVVRQAEKAGAKVVKPVANMPWGDRWALLEDGFGNMWQVATHIEDLTPEEAKRRMAQASQ